MNRKIGIVTWIGYPNFGTYLQAFALRRCIEKMGYEVKFISDEKLINSSRFPKLDKWPIIRKNLSRLSVHFSNIKLRISQSSKNKLVLLQKKKYRNFKLNYLPCATHEDIFDAYVAGSDQIWSVSDPMREWMMRHYFLADFSNTKLAYAPSLAFSESQLDKYEKTVSPWLSKFKAISAREPGGAEILSKIVGNKVPILLDPTLLLDKEDWINFIGKDNPSSEKDDYCLCYLLTYRQEVIDNAKKYADQRGIKLKLILHNKDIDLKGKDIEKLTIDPREFVKVIANASCMVTDSFHGTIFSTIFNIPRTIIKRFKDSELNIQNQRITNFLSLIKSKAHFVNPEEPITYNTMFLEPHDWKSNIEALVHQSLEFLQVNLSDE